MHELSICASIADIVTRHAGDREVSTIHIQIGRLRQIVPETLVYCWSLVSAETALAGTQLAVESISARIKCHACDHIAEIGEFPIFVCTECASTDVELISGEEFLITSLDVAEGAKT